MASEDTLFDALKASVSSANRVRGNRERNRERIATENGDAAADRDRRFAEAVRREYDEFQVGITDDRKTMSVLMAELIQHVSVEHRRIYGTSCTAGAKEK